MTASPAPFSHGLPTPRRTPSSSSGSGPTSIAMDIPRRPSPWHGLAHSLSSTSIGCRRMSSGSVPRYSTPTPPESIYLLPTPPQSSYILTTKPSRTATPTKARSGSRTPALGPSGPAGGKLDNDQGILHSTPLTPTSPNRPRLCAEHDKAGHIEYKLKLLDPSPERFEKLVTQMLWRLKEGRGEAIYEIGLADDGTVVGLSRNDMEASLRTLELMAAEIGATVMILKEIVLAGSGLEDPSAPPALPPASPTVSSSVKPKKSREFISLSKWEADKELRIGKGKNKFVVFDPDDLAAGEDGLSSDEDDEAEPSGSGASSSRSGSVSEDGMTFALDLDAPSLAALASPPGTEPPRHASSKKFRRKEERRSARRLDLLRGDGTGPLWIPGVGPDSPEPSATQDVLTGTRAKEESLDADPVLEDVFHDPFTTLSLSFADIRLIPAPPLASSVSSSDVTSLPGSSAPSSCSSSTYLPSTGYDLDPADKVCIEALIVRKNVHGDGVSHVRRRTATAEGHTGEVYEDYAQVQGVNDEAVGDEDEDDWYEYGGADDSWGFGGSDDWEDR